MSGKSRLVQIFMKRDEMSKREAVDLVHEMVDRVYDGENPEEVLFDYNLEPDYVIDLIG